METYKLFLRDILAVQVPDRVLTYINIRLMKVTNTLF